AATASSRPGPRSRSSASSKRARPSSSRVSLMLAGGPLLSVVRCPLPETAERRLVLHTTDKSERSERATDHRPPLPIYPRLSDIFEDLFGITSPIPIYSFGAMVAVAILTAAWLSRRELDRMYAEGRIGGVRVAVEEKGSRGKRRAQTQVVSPAMLMGTITVLAVVLGIAGSKLFHILENLGEFFADPLGMIFSTGGLTFYG